MLKVRWLSIILFLVLSSCLPAVPSSTAVRSPLPAPSATYKPSWLSLPSATPAPVMEPPTTGWKTSLPEQQGMDSGRLADLVDFIQREGYNIHSLLVVRHGAIVSETYFDPNQAEIPHELWSVTKSVVSILTGIAIQKGNIKSVDENVVDFFAGRQIANNDSLKQKITLRHLLTMTSGLEWNEDSPATVSLNAMASSPDWVGYVLDRRVIAEPGTTFDYNSGGPHLLSAILQKGTGITTASFARKNLFGPLGITSEDWPSDVSGVTMGGWGLSLTSRDMAKLGYLYLHGGVWDGKQVVPAEWVAASTQNYVASMFGQGYGYLWWIQPPGSYQDPSIASFAARGHGGQFIYVFPQQDMVVVFTSGLGERLINQPQELIKRYILPAVQSEGALPANPEAAARLRNAEKLAAHPQPHAIPDLPETARVIAGKTYMLDSNSLGIQEFSITFHGDTARIDELLTGDQLLQLLVGLDGAFRTTQAGERGIIALKGYWQDGKTLVIDQQVLGKAERLESRITFEGDNLTINGRDLMDGLTTVIHGTAVR